jgi:hypothetical protein
MDESEIALRASALPDLFAARISPEALEGLRLMDEGGEYGELTIELAATLAHTRAPVTAAEQRELRELLTAMKMPTSPVDELEVQD